MKTSDETTDKERRGKVDSMSAREWFPADASLIPEQRIRAVSWRDEIRS
jgi:hypothetical protein